MKKRIEQDVTGWKMWEHGIPDSRVIILREYNKTDRIYRYSTDKVICQCNCSKQTIFVSTLGNVLHGHTKSCGCLRKERTIATCKKYNEYKCCGDYYIGTASNCSDVFYIDADDYDKIKNYCWYKDHTTGYMKTRCFTGKNIFLHRLITNWEYKLVDHINRNKLDNRKSNLRDVSKRTNVLNRNGVISTNTSGRTGVSYSKERNKWDAQITVNNKTIHLGFFDIFDDAVKARELAEIKYFGKVYTNYKK